MKGYRTIAPIISSYFGCRFGYVNAAAFTDLCIPTNLEPHHKISSMKMTSFVNEDSYPTGVQSPIKGPELPPIAPMSKRLFWIRHGEVINPGGDKAVFYGSMDVALSPFGELEAKAAAEYLRQYNLQHVAASPLSRAIYGAKQILSVQNSQTSDLRIYPGFTELDRGAWCGLTKEEIGADMLARFDSCDETVTPADGESYPQLKARVLNARDKLLEITECGKASAIVSHLQVTRSVLSDALGIPTSKMTELTVATASITCIDYDSVSGCQTVHFQSFKPDFGLRQSKDGAN